MEVSYWGLHQMLSVEQRLMSPHQFTVGMSHTGFQQNYKALHGVHFCYYLWIVQTENIKSTKYERLEQRVDASYL